MANFDTTWDINKYKYDHELEHHWELKKAFMTAHKDKLPENRLVCLAQTFCNIEVLGCRYDAKVMNKIISLAEAVSSVTSKVTKEKQKYAKGFVAASDAVVERVKDSRLPQSVKGSISYVQKACEESAKHSRRDKLLDVPTSSSTGANLTRPTTSKHSIFSPKIPLKPSPLPETHVKTVWTSSHNVGIPTSKAYSKQSNSAPSQDIPVVPPHFPNKWNRGKPLPEHQLPSNEILRTSHFHSSPVSTVFVPNKLAPPKQPGHTSYQPSQHVQSGPTQTHYQQRPGRFHSLNRKFPPARDHRLNLTEVRPDGFINNSVQNEKCLNTPEPWNHYLNDTLHQLEQMSFHPHGTSVETHFSEAVTFNSTDLNASSNQTTFLPYNIPMDHHPPNPFYQYMTTLPNQPYYMTPDGQLFDQNSLPCHFF